MIRHTKDVPMPSNVKVLIERVASTTKERRVRAERLLAKIPDNIAGTDNIVYQIISTCGDVGDDSDMQHNPDAWARTYYGDDAFYWMEQANYEHGVYKWDDVLAMQSYCRYIYNAELHRMFVASAVLPYPFYVGRRLGYKLYPSSNGDIRTFIHDYGETYRFYDGSTYEHNTDDVPKIRIELSPSDDDDDGSTAFTGDHEVYIYNDADDTELFHYLEVGKPWLWIQCFSKGTQC